MAFLVAMLIAIGVIIPSSLLLMDLKHEADSMHADEMRHISALCEYFRNMGWSATCEAMRNCYDDELDKMSYAKGKQDAYRMAYNKMRELHEAMKDCKTPSFCIKEGESI